MGGKTQTKPEAGKGGGRGGRRGRKENQEEEGGRRVREEGGGTGDRTRKGKDPIPSYFPGERDSNDVIKGPKVRGEKRERERERRGNGLTVNV